MEIKLEQWVSAVSSAIGSIDQADEATREIWRWIDQNLVPADIRPREMPRELARPLNVLHDALSSCKVIVAELQSDLLRVLIQIQGGRRLTREQFYLAMAFGLLNFSNRSTGVYQFDDYEIFDFFCYEDQEQCGYIQPSLEPNPPPVQGTEITLTARTGPGLAPEDVFWHRLRSAQRLFFESYLSEVAMRFKRD